MRRVQEGDVFSRSGVKPVATSGEAATIPLLMTAASFNWRSGDRCLAFREALPLLRSQPSLRESALDGLEARWLPGDVVPNESPQ